MDPIKREPAAVKADIEKLLELYKKSFKEVQPDSPYFNGYRACLETISEDVKKIPTDM
jgi:hypothetical protein